MKEPNKKECKLHSFLGTNNDIENCPDCKQEPKECKHKNLTDHYEDVFCNDCGKKQEPTSEDWEKEFENEFDWREIQYDGSCYVPTNYVKQFITNLLKSEREKAFIYGKDEAFKQATKIVIDAFIII